MKGGAPCFGTAPFSYTKYLKLHSEKSRSYIIKKG